MEIIINEYENNYGLWDKDLDKEFKPKRITVTPKFINVKPNDILLLLVFDYGKDAKIPTHLSGSEAFPLDIKNYHDNGNSLECIYIVCVDCCGVKDFEASATILFE